MNAKEREKILHEALRRIAYDYMELSWEKAQYQRNDHVLIAREALERCYPTTEPKPSKKLLDNDF